MLAPSATNNNKRQNKDSLIFFFRKNWHFPIFIFIFFRNFSFHRRQCQLKVQNSQREQRLLQNEKIKLNFDSSATCFFRFNFLFAVAFYDHIFRLCVRNLFLLFSGVWRVSERERQSEENAFKTRKTDERTINILNFFLVCYCFAFWILFWSFMVCFFICFVDVGTCHNRA